MSWLKGVRVRLRAWLRPNAVEREVEEELRWHIDMEAEKRIREGLTPEAARREALVAFGGVERWPAEHREVRGALGPERLFQDFRYVFGSLLRSRLFTASSVFILALGIGANTAAFGVLNALLYRPPMAVGEPAGLYRVHVLTEVSDPRGGGATTRPIPTSYPVYAELRDRTKELPELAAYWYRTVILGPPEEAQELRAASVSSNYFDVLRVHPRLGRFWTGARDADAEPVTVLGYHFWVRAFGGDVGVIGRTLEISAVPVTIVGVAPKGFQGIDLNPVDLWLPLEVETRISSSRSLEQRNVSWLLMVGRTAGGTSPDLASERATGVLTVALQAPDSYLPRGTVDLVSATDRFGGYSPTAPVPVWLLAVTVVVLLIACANVSNLLLARAAGRRRELAVRASLGASRRRLLQLLLIESLLLSGLAAVAVLGIATWSTKLLHTLELPPVEPLVDRRVLALSLSLAFTTTLLVGLLPALRASGGNLERELRAASHSSERRSRLRNALTASQIALSIALLVNAGLFVQSLRNVSAVATTFDPDRVAEVSIRFLRGTATERILEVKEAGVERLRALSGVSSADLAIGTPFASGIGVLNLQPEQLGLSTAAELPVIPVFGGPEYFRVMELSLRAGRLFDESDVAGAPPVFVVNETLARTLGGTEPALRKCLRTRDGDCARIVGVVADARFFQPLEEPWPAIYGPLAQYTWVGAPASARLVVRTDRPVDELAGSIRRVLVGLGSEIQFVDVRSISSLLEPDLQPWHVATIVFTLFGTLSFVLAAGGLYVVVAYLVAARKHEIGVRLALGARPLRILRMVLGEGTLLAMIGGTVGVVIAGAVSRLLAHRMYGVRLADPLTYAVVAALVITVALLASLSSARRATKVDPAHALRSD